MSHGLSLIGDRSTLTRWRSGFKDGLHTCCEEQQRSPRFSEVEPDSDRVLVERKAPSRGPVRRLEHLCLLELVVAPRPTSPGGEGPFDRADQSRGQSGRQDQRFADFDVELLSAKGHPGPWRWWGSMNHG